MGINPMIYVKASRDEIGYLQSELQARSLLDDHESFKYFQDHGELYLLTRYFRPGYERGHWPQIAPILEFLMRTPFEVRYGSDTGEYEHAVIVDPEFIQDCWGWWSGPHWRDYWNEREAREAGH